VGNHGLRHSFASLVVLLHLPEPVLQAVGGWKDSATVHKIYTHISQRDLTEQLADVQAWFEAGPAG
ncbi:MAG: tyrosine-type recombinase/integrase, partial [Clostridiales bacterium]|nr:tyrosine-type recombinase/integrase [Clostridiales bacterium]